jgi:hypothetical protein
MILDRECPDLMAPKVGLTEQLVDISKTSIWACFTCDMKGRATLVGLELGDFCLFQRYK